MGDEGGESWGFEWDWERTFGVSSCDGGSGVVQKAGCLLGARPLGWLYEVGLARVVHEILRLCARSVCEGWICHT